MTRQVVPAGSDPGGANRPWWLVPFLAVFVALLLLWRYLAPHLAHDIDRPQPVPSQETIDAQPPIAAVDAPLSSPGAGRTDVTRVAEPDAAAGPPGVPVLPPLRAHVTGFVRRPSTGAAVTDGFVELAFVDLADARLDAAQWRALDDEARRARQEYLDAEIGTDGRFTLEFPCPGIVRAATLKPRLDPDVQATQFLETEITLGELLLDRDRPLELVLDVDEGASIRGVVIDADGRFPITGARVSVPWWDQDVGLLAVSTDLEGRFHVAGIRPEVALAGTGPDLVADAAGYVTRRVEVAPPTRGMDIDDVVLELRRGITVRGSFVGAPQPPELRLSLWLYRRDPRTTGPVRRLEFLEATVPADDGSFSFAPVPACEDACLDVDPVVPPLVVRSLDLRSDPAPLVIALPALEKVRPPTVPGRPASTGPWLTAPRGGEPELARLVFPDNEGRFWADPVALAALELRQLGRAQSDMTLALSLSRATDGAPLARARIGLLLLEQRGVEIGGGTTDDGGSCETKLMPGRHFVRVRCAGYESEDFEVVAVPGARYDVAVVLRRNR